METQRDAIPAQLRNSRRTMASRLVRYGILGGTTTLLYFAVVALLVELVHVDAVLAAVVGTGVIIIVSYVGNRIWVFASDREHSSAFPRFLAASAMSMALSAGVMHLVVHVLGMSYLIGLVATTLVVPPTNFVVNYFWCFRSRDAAR